MQNDVKTWELRELGSLSQNLVSQWLCYWGSRRKIKIAMDSKDFEPLKSESQLGQDAMPCEDYVIVQGEDIIDIECCMLELLDMALGQRIEPTSSNLTAKPLHTLDVDERPPPIVKLADAQHHSQLLDTLGTGGALHCQVEHHVRDKKKILFLNCITKMGQNFIKFLPWVDVHNIYYIGRNGNQIWWSIFLIKHIVSRMTHNRTITITIKMKMTKTFK